MGKQYKKKQKNIWTGEGYVSALLRMLPVLLIASIVPLIVRQYAYKTGMAGYPWFSFYETMYEFFLAPKSVALLILFFVMSFVIIIRFRKEKKNILAVKLLYPLFAYLLLVFLSALFSVNRDFSFSGSYEQFESVWVLLSYGVSVIYILILAKSAMEKQVVVDSLCLGSTFIGIIGFLQGLGKDPISTTFIQKLITTEKFLAANGGKLDINFGSRQAYATLYNPNYLGVYGSFVLPFLAALLLLEKNKWRRIWHLVNLTLVSGAVLFSGSRAGLIAAFLACFVLLIVCFKSFLKWWYLSIPAVNFVIALVLLVNNYEDNAIFNRLKAAFTPNKVVIEEMVAEDGSVVKKTGLTEMYTAKDGVAIRYNEVFAKISIYVNENSFGVYAFSEDGEQLALNPNENGTEFRFEEAALKDVIVEPVQVGNDIGFMITADGTHVFRNNGEEYTYFNEIGPVTPVYRFSTEGENTYFRSVGREGKAIMADSMLFKKNLGMLSGRLFIWSRTVPLLMKHIILGSGPDTFVLEYPQEDYLMMTKYGYNAQIMTKPHCLYLQVGVQTGVLSLICLLVFFGWYAIQSLKLYCFKEQKTQLDAIGVSAFVGSIGFFISGLSNDSMVVTTPVFFIMIGIGIAVNAQKKKEIAEKTTLK